MSDALAAMRRVEHLEALIGDYEAGIVGLLDQDADPYRQARSYDVMVGLRDAYVAERDGLLSRVGVAVDGLA